MNEADIPAALYDAVRRDLKPVRSLVSPERRALALLPVGIILLVGLPEFWSWKTHVVLAPWSSWGTSVVEMLLSLVILAAGFREAVPGRELSSCALTVLLCISATTFILVNATMRSPFGIDHALWLQWFRECIVTAVAFSIPALIAPAWLVSRALPNRPALTGALCGLGVGLMADAGLRLFCWDGDYAHVLIAHGGAILILVALGALSATVIERIKALVRPVGAADRG
jgi:hypothetical protein